MYTVYCCKNENKYKYFQDKTWERLYPLLIIIIYYWIEWFDM